MTTLAYSHTLVAGTPENINDVQDMFNDVKTAFNGNIDAGNLATSAKPATLMGAYRTVGLAPFYLQGGPGITAGTYFTQSNSFLALSGAGISSAPMTIPVNLTDFAVSGLGTRFRLAVSYLTNTVGTNITFTFGLYPLGSTGGTGGGMTLTLGTVVSGSTTAVANPSGPGNIAAGSDFTISGSAGYLPGVVLSGAPTTGSVINGYVILQVRNV